MLLPKLALLSLTLTLAGGCASTPELAPIDNALLVEASSSARALVGEARAARDAAGDNVAARVRDSERAEEQVNLARASLRTARAQLDEAKLTVEIAGSSGAAADLDQAQANYAYVLSNADYARESLAVRKRELELAKLEEKLARELHRLRSSQVELTKAEALRGVELIEAKKIPIEDYRKQVVYHQEEMETARGRVRTAQARLDEAQSELDKVKRKLDSLRPHGG